MQTSTSISPNRTRVNESTQSVTRLGRSHVQIPTTSLFMISTHHYIGAPRINCGPSANVAFRSQNGLLCSECYEQASLSLRLQHSEQLHYQWPLSRTAPLQIGKFPAGWVVYREAGTYEIEIQMHCLLTSNIGNEELPGLRHRSTWISSALHARQPPGF